MLPSHLVGTIITSQGQEPFTLQTATGAVQRGRFAAVDPMQRSIGSTEVTAVERQVRATVGAEVRAVRVGAYCCPTCGIWVDVTRRPERWAGECCRKCSA
ncbi:MAG: hypothetical protein DRI90_17495 [Deltaproteobacteria bacterium]|nr:MAG: hypothetical protein DRI90_17495 [Deltaproteobacteria bacterium]